MAQMIIKELKTLKDLVKALRNDVENIYWSERENRPSVDVSILLLAGFVNKFQCNLNHISTNPEEESQILEELNIFSKELCILMDAIPRRKVWMNVLHVTHVIREALETFQLILSEMFLNIKNLFTASCKVQELEYFARETKAITTTAIYLLTPSFDRDQKDLGFMDFG